MPPSISIIIRTVDRTALLREAMQSLANQTRQDFEVVIVDMSNGAAHEVIAQFSERLSLVLHPQPEQLLNRPAASNFGIRYATADKITILDDDNLFDPNQVEILVRGLEETSADLVYTGVRRTTYNEAGDLVDTKIWHEPYDFAKLLTHNYIHGVGTAFRKDAWERIGGFDERFAVYEDYDILLRIALNGCIERLPEITGESRSFTGIIGLQNHATETETVNRCLAGLYWKHRNLFFPRGQRLSGYANQLQAKGIIKGASRGNDIVGTTVFSARMLRNLVSWWRHN
jgi:glycosyltransferase involved in cell wall biosynthesis